MAIFVTRSFAKWAKKEDLGEQVLCDAVKEMLSGLYEADLGGGLLKKRIARPGQGKRAGFRTIVATNKDSRWIFVYGFAKSERSNIDKDEEKALKALATHLLSLTPQAINKAKAADELKEVDCDAQDKVKNS